jgi:hypothetical protein
LHVLNAEYECIVMIVTDLLLVSVIIQEPPVIYSHPLNNPLKFLEEFKCFYGLIMTFVSESLSCSVNPLITMFTLYHKIAEKHLTEVRCAHHKSMLPLATSWPGRVVNTLDFGSMHGSSIPARAAYTKLWIQRVCRMRLETVVPCTWVSIPGHARDITLTQWTPILYIHRLPQPLPTRAVTGPVEIHAFSTWN